MLYGYLSRVYTDLVSLPLSVEMTGERSLHFPATILRHHITVLTVQVTEQHLGCYRATMEERAVTCEGITLTSMYERTKARLRTPHDSTVRSPSSSSSTVKITAENGKQISRRKLGQTLELETESKRRNFKLLDFSSFSRFFKCLP